MLTLGQLKGSLPSGVLCLITAIPIGKPGGLCKKQALALLSINPFAYLFRLSVPILLELPSDNRGWDEENSILDRKDLNQDDRDYLRVLGILVYDYEEKNERFPELTDAELLQAFMEEYNLEMPDILDIFRQEQIILDILNGKRQLDSQEAFKLRSLLLWPKALGSRSPRRGVS